jgi:hypothetical protein
MSVPHLLQNVNSKSKRKGDFFMEEQKVIEAVRKAQREYNKKWRAANKDKVRQYNKNFWKKRALASVENAENAENAEHKKEEENQ